MKNNNKINEIITNIEKFSSLAKKSLSNILNKIAEEENTVIVSSRSEISFGEILIKTLKLLNIKVETQKPMFDGKYRIDFYLPEFNLAIEYDEEQHKHQQEEDKQREEEIKKSLSCKFVRLDYKQDDCYNVGLVLKEVFGR